MLAAIDAQDTAALRRGAVQALVAGLSVAGLVAVAALLTDTAADLNWRVVGTSLGFSVFSATAAAGAALRLREPDWARLSGGGTVVASLVAFVFLLAALWLPDLGEEGLWRGFGVATLLALWGSHASLMLRARRPGDRPAVRTLTTVSVTTLGIDSAVAILGVLGTLDDVDWGSGSRLVAALVVVALLSTAMVPLLRRLDRDSRDAPPVGAAAHRRDADDVAAEIAAAAARLAAMDLPLAAQSQVARLRDLARELGS